MELLTCKERNYLRHALSPYNVLHIRKDRTSDRTREFITVAMKDTSPMIFPFFVTGEHYKGMEGGRNYSYEELFKH